MKDRYVTPALLDGLEEWAITVWRRPVAAGHWVIRVQPALIARWVGEVIDFVETGSGSTRPGRLPNPRVTDDGRPAPRVQPEVRGRSVPD